MGRAVIGAAVFPCRSNMAYYFVVKRFAQKPILFRIGKLHENGSYDGGDEDDEDDKGENCGVD